MTAKGLGRARTPLRDADRRDRTQATTIRSIWAKFTLAPVDVTDRNHQDTNVTISMLREVVWSCSNAARSIAVAR
jgi:hypothetical protein